MSISSSRSGLSERSYTSTSTKLSAPSTRSTTSSRSYNPYKRQYHVAEDVPNWWSIGDFIQPGLTHQSVGLSLYSGRSLFDANSDEEIWDLRESLQDLYREVDQRSQVISSSFRKSIINNNKVDIKNWLDKDTNNGLVRVFSSESSSKVSHLVPCTLTTTAQRVCYQCNMPPNSLYVQLNGDIIRRLELFDCPLAIQNDYLATIGYNDIRKIQEEGANDDLAYLVKFYAGKPYHDGTYARNQLQAYLLIRKGKLLHQWVRRLCVISGTRLLIHRDKDSSNSKPIEVQLAKGAVEEVQVKGHEYCLKVTSTLQGEKSVYLSFTEEAEFNRWLRKAKKATSKLPTKADLSNCHLEFLPETIFINDGLKILNLRHNVLRERPIEEDIYTIGWLDDLHRFYKLHSLNLADNDLHQFPMALCDIKTLAELNLASNKIEEIPSDIANLKNLQIFQLHNNHLSSLPETLSTLKKLVLLTLAFNNFTTVPGALLQSHDSDKPKVDSLILAGNNIDRFSSDTLKRMKHVRKLDLRLNKLLLPPSEQGKLSNMELVTHLDLRDNNIADLDVRCLKKVEYLNCCRNRLKTLQVSGVSLKTLIANHNQLEALSISPKPEWLETMDVSHNSIFELPEWVVDTFFLVKLNISHNQLMRFPNSMFENCRKLKVLHANHNNLLELPEQVNPLSIEEMYLQHNRLTQLPWDLLAKANKLRVLNVSHNNLQQLPPLNENESLNKVQELYLTSNRIEDEAVRVLCGYPRLKVLHLAHNNITEIMDRDVGKLELLHELNVSGNKLSYLPSSLTYHSKLTILRANSNQLHTLPDFGKTMSLRVLEVGCNQLVNVSMTNLYSSQLNLLDVSGNPKLMVDSHDIQGLSEHKKLRPVDPTGTNRLLWDLTYQQKEAEDRLAERQRWLAGFSQTSGNRNKLSVKVLSLAQLRSESDGLFAVFDGGRNADVAKILHDSFPSIIQHELTSCKKKELYMKYAVLAAHKKLKVTGQKLGASAVLCHILKGDNPDQLLINVANVGDCELVMCRRGNGYCLTRPFMVTRDREDCKRILRSDGIITEDDKVNGISCTTRMIGCAFLYPQVIPNPHFFSYALHPDDEFIIMANKGLWDFIGYQEAVEEVRRLHDPVAATKKLQDLAQAYGSKENIGILILRIKAKHQHGNGTNGHIQSDSNKPVTSEKPLDGFRLAAECHDDWGLDDWGSVYSLSTTTTSDFEPLSFGSQPAEEEKLSVSPEPLKTPPQKPASAKSERKVVKPPIAKKPTKIKTVNSEVTDDDTVLSPSTHTSQISIRPLPRQRITDKSPVEAWEAILQDRLSEEVKTKELQYMWGPQEDTIDMDSSFGAVPPNGTSSNWSTLGKKKGEKMAVAVAVNGTEESPTTIDKQNEKIFSHTIASPPWTDSQLTVKLEQVAASANRTEQQSAASANRTDQQSAASSAKPEKVSASPSGRPSPPPEPRQSPSPSRDDQVDYIRYVGPTVDRDALLFHQMNQARAKSCSMASIDTVRSDIGAPRSGVLAARCAPISHSIEVIVRDDPDEGYEPHDDYIPEEGEIFEGYDDYIQGSNSSLDEDTFSEGSFIISDLDLDSNSSSLVQLAPDKLKIREDQDRTPTNSASEETLKNSERGVTPVHHGLNKLQTASQYSVAQVSTVSSTPSVASLVVTHL